MHFTALLLHLAGFVAPAIVVALGTTLMGRWEGGGTARLRWWAEWAWGSAVGVLALLVVLWLSGRDGTVAGYGALIVSCAMLSWLLSLPRRRGGR